VLSHLETGAKGDDDPACGHGLHAGDCQSFILEID
jgi:hypothetical protein